MREIGVNWWQCQWSNVVRKQSCGALTNSAVHKVAQWLPRLGERAKTLASPGTCGCSAFSLLCHLLLMWLFVLRSAHYLFNNVFWKRVREKLVELVIVDCSSTASPTDRNLCDWVMELHHCIRMQHAWVIKLHHLSADHAVGAFPLAVALPKKMFSSGRTKHLVTNWFFGQSLGPVHRGVTRG